jgi:nitrite reductase/ring-hydroxylating ferredoxin subunit
MKAVYLCTILDLPVGKLIAYSIEYGPAVVLYNDGNSIKAFQRFCPHQNLPLDVYGQVSGNTLTCTEHGFKFCTETGTYLKQVPKCAKVETYAVKVSESNEVFVLL